MALTPLVGLITSWSSLVIPGLFLFQRPQRLTRETKLLFAYAIFSFTNDRLHEFFHSSSTFYTLSFTFAIIEYILFAALLFLLLQKRRHKRWIIAGSLFFAAISVFTLINSGVANFGSIRGIEVLLLISYIMLFFLEWITAESFEPIDGKPEFWIVTGCLLYLAGNFFFFITVDNQLIHSLLIHFLVNLLRNACFITAIIRTFHGDNQGQEDEWMGHEINK